MPACFAYLLDESDRAKELLEGERERRGCAERLPDEELAFHAREDGILSPHFGRTGIGVDHPAERVHLHQRY